MNRKYKRHELEKQIMNYCKIPKSAVELSNLTGVNLNTLRSKYIYALYKQKKIYRYLRKYRTVKISE